MGIEQDYRNELKFEVSDIMLEEIRYRIAPVMRVDAHQEGDAYLIRSLYFDDLRDTCLQENEAGIDKRSKYRIRAYNRSADFIALERKSKLRGLTSKEQARITMEQYERYIGGEPVRPIEDLPPLMRELEYERIRAGMRPKCIVEYERTAFVYPIGNVRVTFDRNIRGSDKLRDMFCEKLDAYPVLPAGHSILEVKFDKILPSFILQLLDLGTLRHQSFSKYYYARKTIEARGLFI